MNWLLRIISFGWRFLLCIIMTLTFILYYFRATGKCIQSNLWSAFHFTALIIHLRWRIEHSFLVLDHINFIWTVFVYRSSLLVIWIDLTFRAPCIMDLLSRHLLPLLLSTWHVWTFWRTIILSIFYLCGIIWLVIITFGLRCIDRIWWCSKPSSVIFILRISFCMRYDIRIILPLYWMMSVLISAGTPCHNYLS